MYFHTLYQVPNSIAEKESRLLYELIHGLITDTLLLVIMHFTKNQLEYILLKPDKLLADIVESIWMVKNYSEEEREGIIIPDGKIDLFLLEGENNSFEIFLSGICTHPIIYSKFKY
jgi:hypothetical protein